MSRIGSLIFRRALETITYQRQTGHSASGDATFGAQATMQARVERSTGETPDLEGRRVDGKARLFTTEALALGDRVWLSEDSTSSNDASARVVRVVALRDLDGNATHWESELS